MREWGKEPSEKEEPKTEATIEQPKVEEEVYTHRVMQQIKENEPYKPKVRKKVRGLKIIAIVFIWYLTIKYWRGNTGAFGVNIPTLFTAIIFIITVKEITEKIWR